MEQFMSDGQFNKDVFYNIYINIISIITSFETYN